MPIDPPEDQSGISGSFGDTPGCILRRVREELGLDEKHIADRLHITVHYVKAIENDRYEKLPGLVFAKGYLKSYANIVGIDPDEVLASFIALQEDQQSSGKEEIAQKQARESTRRLQMVAASALVFVAVITAAWYFTGAPEPASSSASVQDSIAEPTANSAPVPATALETTAESTTAVTTTATTTDSNEQLAPPADIAADSSLIETAEAVIAEEAQISEDSALDAPGQNEAVLAAQSSDADTPLEVEESASALEEDSAADSLIAEAANEPAVDVVAAATNSSALPNTVEAVPRPEELTDINVLEGENGERIIAVDAQGEDRLRISFSGESWVEINDGENRQIYRDLREQGDILEVSGHAPFNILLGDAPFTSLNFNGSDIDVSESIRIDNSARLTVGL